jgi:hypothetical protein
MGLPFLLFGIFGVVQFARTPLGRAPGFEVTHATEVAK